MRTDDNNNIKRETLHEHTFMELCSNYPELYSLLLEHLRLPNLSVVRLIFIGSPFHVYMKQSLVLKL